MAFKFPKSISDALKAPFERKSLNQFLAPSRIGFVDSNKFTYNVAKSVLQGTARSGAAVGLTVAGQDNIEVPKVLTPLYGKSPLRGFSGVGEETLQSFGANKLSKNKNLTFALGGGLSLLDFTGGKSKAIKSLAKVDDILETSKILKGMKLSDDIITDIAPKIAQTTDPKIIKGLIEQATSASSKAAKLGSKTTKAATELIDRFAPIKAFIGKSNVAIDKDPYVAARNFAGRFGKIQNRLDDLSNILRPNSGVLDKAKEYAKLERFEELAGRGITKFEGGLTLDQITKNKLDLEKSLGDNLPAVKGVLDQLRKYTDNLLVESKNAGIISEETLDLIRKNNQKYIPLQRLEYLADQADNLPRGAKTFSVATQDIIKSIKGSEKEVVDPIESIIRNTYKTVNLVERNKVAQKVADLSHLDEFKDLVKPIEGNVPAGFDKISVFRNGIKEEYAVPKELADTLKGLNEKNIDIVTQLAGKMGGLLRAGATSLNVGFIPANALRDFQTATLVSKVGFTPWDWLKGFSEAIKKGDDYKAFLESGGSFSGYFEQTKKLSKTVKQLKEGKSLKAIKTIVNPVKLMQKVGETIELAPRLGVFKRSLGKGLSATESAFNAREATVDFAKSGSVMKIANLWVPFLNARLQGTINTLKAVKQRPVRSALIIGSMVEMPVIATYYHNTKFHKEIWDDIAQHEKDNNFLIIYGDGRDEEGNPTQVIKIPKGDVGKVFGNPTENFLTYLDKNDPKAIGQVITEAFSNISPVDFAQNGELSPRTALSGILPPTVKGGVESVTNVNLFTGREIVPRSLQDASPEEQYKDSTSPIAIKLGAFLNMSPAKIENFVGTQFGGLGRQLINPGQAATQVSSRFAGATGGAGEQKDFKSLDKATQEGTDERIRDKRKAQKLFNELKNLSPDERRDMVQNKLKSGEIDASILETMSDLVEDTAKGVTDFEQVFRSKPNNIKAKFLVEKLETLSMDERRTYFQNLYVKGLLSEGLMKEISEEIKKRAQQ